MNFRFAAWLVTLGLAVGSCIAYGQIVSAFDVASIWRVLLPAVIGIAGLLLVFLSPDIGSVCRRVFMLWIPAIVLRVVLLPAAPSDDVNRYLWEGKLVREKISPYTHTANSGDWVAFRDTYWEGMNHKDKLTAYPPLSELAFGAIGFFSYHPLAYKLAFVLADLLTLAAVLALLRRRGMSPAFAGLYAFSPVVLLSFAAEVHFDVLMVAPLVWAVYLFETGRVRWAVALAAIASGVKWITLPLIPFFAGRRLISSALISVAVLLLPALLFWETLPNLLRGFVEFGGARSFNGPVYDFLLRVVGLPRDFCSMLVGALLLSVLLWRWFYREHAGLDSHIRWVTGALIILSPTVHFWYLAWLMPFVALRPSLAWMSFSVTVGCYFFVWINDYWGLLAWQQFLFWAPFCIGLVYDLWSTRGRGFRVIKREPFLDQTVGVVIPTLNAAQDLPRAFESLDAQTEAIDEIVLVDAGSTDETIELAKASGLPVQIVESERGRGQQIAAGIEASSAAWVIVLHADCVLGAESVAQLKVAGKTNPQLLGGAFGQRFAGAGPGLLLIELLNDLRSVFSRTAFGDQVQFYHRASALKYEFMPKQPLMEDVESSWRVREVGEFAFLGQPALSSHRKWVAGSWASRVALVFRLVSRYRIARTKGRECARQLSLELYQEYYSTRK